MGAMNEVAGPDDKTTSRPLAGARRVALFAVLVAILVFAANYGLVTRPVNQALAADTRNAGYALWAHYRWFVDPGTLVLDLRRAEAAAPIDLFRGLFQSAAAFAAENRQFDRVILARAGEPVFVLKGESYATLGREFQAGQNPVFLIRTLPEKLFRPSGEQAYPQWTGGLLGVVGKQMEDANKVARDWAGAQ
jgi:hypothetical protein